MLRYWTAGESHGKTLLALVDGFPAGFELDLEAINYDLKMRQGGYGRGGRQKIETDKVEVLTGIWKNVTMGSPVTLQVINKDYKLERMKDLERPRPGHGDLTGAVKYLGSIRKYSGTSQCERNGCPRCCRRTCKTDPQAFWN